MHIAILERKPQSWKPVAGLSLPQTPSPEAPKLTKTSNLYLNFLDFWYCVLKDIKKYFAAN